MSHNYQNVLNVGHVSRNMGGGLSAIKHKDSMSDKFAALSVN